MLGTIRSSMQTSAFNKMNVGVQAEVQGTRAGASGKKGGDVKVSPHDVRLRAVPAGPALIRRGDAWTLENSVSGGSYNVTRGTIYAPSVHGFRNSPKFGALPGDCCAAAATEDEFTSVVPLVEFIAPESADSCAAAALDDEAPVNDAPRCCS